jgi:hypothetical protein
VVQNIERLQRLKSQGIYRLYEAVDFTASRLAVGQNMRRAHVYGSPSRHGTLALNNYLMGNPIVRRFHSDPH